MKATGKCCKCKGDEIYSNLDLPQRGERSSIAGANGRVSSNLWLHVYVCLSCGFVEEYITPNVLNNEKKIDAIKSTWERVN